MRVTGSTSKWYNNSMIDISSVTDLQELKALRGDAYQDRENARADVYQADQLIALINERISQLMQSQDKPSRIADPDSI